MEEIDCPMQTPDLNLSKYFWNELECCLQARSSRLTLVPDLTKGLVAE